MTKPSSDDPFVDHRSMGAAGSDPLDVGAAEPTEQVKSATQAHVGHLGRSAVGGEELLRVDDLSVEFPTDDGVVHAVRGVSYALHAGEVLGIVGESGSGKSVSSMAVMGLLPRSARISGDVSFRGEDVLSMPPAVQRSLRGRKIAMIFQDPMTAMNPVHTVGDQLAEAVLSHELMPRKKALARAEEALGMVGIPQPKTRLRNYPHEFSGGMRQRAMIAMAIINDPDVIIADEPTTALDVTVQAQILEKLVEVKDAIGAAIVLITHDLGVVAGMTHRVLVMYAGRAVEVGETDDIFYRTRMPYTAGLLGSIPSLDSDDDGRLRPIHGTPPSLIHLPAGCPFSPRCPLATDLCRQTEPELFDTDVTGHVAACHHWRRLAEADDPTTFFRSESEAS
ncbi:peptide/nickel transport system ATP-binding protein [Haloactinopolyspora alba]|uniref:Peptide/nickel transport system ATP-binding protein n=1 Tax=Haloactinopolyspora alba TaxID=648780 RepID=A0A2P8DX75_9ACTN|nr:ABC transporter ATP-binding protein [Haloactinopolyspora alba]PSL01821.1 peptide/nickel transport system ATP-binding protein [Haloactinopolyspora alba]